MNEKTTQKNGNSSSCSTNSSEANAKISSKLNDSLETVTLTTQSSLIAKHEQANASLVSNSKTSRINQKRQRQHLAKLYLSLGHFYLLIYDYAKALHSYQKFLTFRINKLKVKQK